MLMRSTPTRSTSSRRVAAWFSTALLLLLILASGLFFRGRWDQLGAFHPDERFILYTVDNLRIPTSWRDYFTSSCPSPMPNPRNASEPMDKMEPTLQSGCSTLNPRNYNSSRMFVYGTLPTTLTRLVFEATTAKADGSVSRWAPVFKVLGLPTGGSSDPANLVVVGRRLSAFFDMLTVFFLFCLGRQLYGRRVGLIAAAGYAWAVMPIQQSHFFTTDNFGTTFVVLTLWFAVRVVQRERLLDAVLLGISLGAAVACKINLAAAVVIVGLAALMVALRPWIRPTWFGRTVRIYPEVPERAGQFRRSFAWATTLFILAGLASFFTFRVAQPDAFVGLNGLSFITPEPRFLEDIRKAREFVNGMDWPPAHQWANRTPYVFALDNMIRWGMGVPLGVAAWTTWAVVGYLLLRRRAWQHLLPWGWITIYFAWQGGGFNPTVRYFLSIYPPLILLAAWGLDQLWQRARVRWGRFPARPFLMRAALPLVLLVTFAWAWSFTRIYARDHIRNQAIEWIKQNTPQGAAVSNEVWDDDLTEPGHSLELQMFPYAEDELTKYINPDGQGLINQLAQLDYVVLSSNRVYDSVVRLPHRFPATIRYYQGLFDGSLGYDFVQRFESFPAFFGVAINDSGADEAFTVYDHPQVYIFKRTERFNPDTARRVIIDGVNWNEVYGTSAKQANDAPTSLRLPARTWDAISTSNTSYLLSGLTGIPALLAWIGGLELLALAMWGWLWRFAPGLRRHSLALARPLGVIAWAAPLALLATVIGAGRWLWVAWYALFVIVGLRIVVGQRRTMWQWLRVHTGNVWATQLVYGAMLGVGMVLRLLHPSFISGDEQLRLAQWTALLRSAMLPPYDPLFVGGQLTVAYAVQLPLAGLTKVLGIFPAVALNLALPTMLALLALAVWAAVQSIAERRAAVYDDGQPASRRTRMGWLAPLAAVLVAVMPGFGIGEARNWTVWGALSGANLSLLGTAMALAATLALGVALVRAVQANGWRPNVLLGALWVLPLAIVAGQGMRLLLVPWLVVTAWGLFVTGRRWLNWLGFAAVLGGSAAALGRVWNTSITPATDITAPVMTPGTVGALVGLGVVLAALTVLASLRRSGGGIVGALLLLGWSTAMVVVQRMATVNADLANGAASPSLVQRLQTLASGPLIFVPALVVLLWAVLMLMFAHRARRSGRDVLHALLALGATLLLLLGVSAFTETNRDPTVVFAAAGVLLAIVAGSYLDTLLLARRRVAGVLGGGIVVAALALSALHLVALPALRTDTARGSFALPDDPIIGAFGSMTANGTPVVAMAETENELATAAVYGGFPQVLSGVQAERTLRAFVSPSVERAINGRRAALEGLYSNDIGRARDAINTYQINYIVVGTGERERYGPSAEQALQALISEGLVKQVYNQADTTVYHVLRPFTETPTFVAVAPKVELPTTKGFLPVAIRALPKVNDFAWNVWANNFQPLAIVLWLLVLQLAGLLVWPLTHKLFGRWHDGGWAWSKILGLALWGWLVWLIASAHILVYSWGALVAGAVTTAVIAAVVGGWRGPRGGVSLWRIWAGGFAGRRRAMLRSEGLFLGAFVIWLMVRAMNPDLWHPSLGGEKPFEFGFLNAIMRSPYMPPADPFFSQGTINYYYYSLFLISVPIKVTGIAPAIGFNLAVAMLFAFVALASASIVRELTGRWRWGMLGALLVVGIGPVGSVMRIGSSKGLGWVIQGLYPGIPDAASGGTLGYVLSHLPSFRGFPGRVGDWFWGPSRIIDSAQSHTITEFPLFAYLFADLHPHMIILPFSLLAAGVALEIVRRAGLGGHQSAQPRLWLPLAVGALLIGTLAAGNSWDAPTYALLLGGALVGSTWRIARFQGRTLLATLGRMVVASVVAVAMTGVGVALFAPFFLNYQAMVGGVGRIPASDTVREYLALFGTTLFIGLSFLIGVLTMVFRRPAMNYRRRVLQAGGAAAVLVLGVLLTSSTFQDGGWSLRELGAWLAGGWGVRVVFSGLVLLAFALALAARLRDDEWMIMWMFTVAGAVLLAIQFIYIRDHLDGAPEWQRMNTIFKFGFQSWALLGIAGAAAVPILFRLFRRLPTLTGTVVWAVLAVAGVGLVVGSITLRESYDVASLGLIGALLLALALISLALSVIRGSLLPRLTHVWASALVVLIMAGAVYPLAGIPSRLDLRFPVRPGWTLDGLAFLRGAEYDTVFDDYFTGQSQPVQRINLTDDRAGIDWLNSNIPGLAVVLHSQRESYRNYGMRIAANTGLPGLLGDLHEAEQRPRIFVDERHRVNEELLNTTDISQTIRLLAQYQVDYVYIGPAERAFSTPKGLAKWEALNNSVLDQRFQSGQVTIYQVRSGLGRLLGEEIIPAAVPAASVPAPPPAPAAPAISNDELSAREDANAADPNNGPVAFGLGEAYKQLGRLTDAVRVLEIGAAANPNDIALHHLLGDTQAIMGNADGAQQAWEKAALASPTMGNWNKLAFGMLPFKRWDVVERAVNEARKIEPQAGDPLYTLGEMYFNRNGEGDRDKAVATYQEFLQLAKPDAPWRTEAAARLQTLGQ